MTDGLSADYDAPECERCEGTGDRYGRKPYAGGPTAQCPDCKGTGAVVDWTGTPTAEQWNEAQRQYDTVHHDSGNRHCLTTPCPWHPGEQRVTPALYWPAQLVTTPTSSDSGYLNASVQDLNDDRSSSPIASAERPDGEDQ